MSDTAIQCQARFLLRLKIPVEAFPNLRVVFSGVLTPLLLMRLIEARLQLSGFTVSRAGSQGPTEDCAMCFYVANHPHHTPVSRSILATLAQFGLREWASLAVFDPEANVDRPIGQQHAGPVDHKVSRQLVEHQRRLLMTALARESWLRKLLRRAQSQFNSIRAGRRNQTQDYCRRFSTGAPTGSL